MKNKPHKGLLKRVRISKSGKIRHRSANHKHLRSGKGGARLRQLRKDPIASNPDAKRLEKLLYRRLRGRTQPRTALRKSPSPAQRREAQAAAKAQAKMIAKSGPAAKVMGRMGRQIARRKAAEAGAKAGVSKKVTAGKK